MTNYSIFHDHPPEATISMEVVNAEVEHTGQYNSNLGPRKYFNYE